jgi:hypothetical protein
MTGAYLAGGMGSWLGTRAYMLFGWTGVCTLVALLAGLALARHLASARIGRQPRAEALARRAAAELCGNPRAWSR